MRTVLCFGDSNTFGYDPLAVSQGTGMRYPLEVRWPGVLQELLGDGWRVIEDGIPGRTTVHEDPFEPALSGRAALPYALKANQPLDVLVLALGTNDLKTCFGLPASDVARGLETLVGMAKGFPWGPGCPVPRIVIVAPPHVGEGIVDVVLSSFDARSAAVSRQVGAACRVIAEEQGCGFVDAAAVCEPGSLDHLHLEPAGHAALARAVAREVVRVCPGAQAAR